MASEKKRTRKAERGKSARTPEAITLKVAKTLARGAAEVNSAVLAQGDDYEYPDASAYALWLMLEIVEALKEPGSDRDLWLKACVNHSLPSRWEAMVALSASLGIYEDDGDMAALLDRVALHPGLRKLSPDQIEKRVRQHLTGRHKIESVAARLALDAQWAKLKPDEIRKGSLGYESAVKRIAKMFAKARAIVGKKHTRSV